jgi:hypothetical protein
MSTITSSLAAADSWCSYSSGFPNWPTLQLPAPHSNSPQQLTRYIYLANELHGLKSQTKSKLSHDWRPVNQSVPGTSDQLVFYFSLKLSLDSCRCLIMECPHNKMKGLQFAVTAVYRQPSLSRVQVPRGSRQKPRTLTVKVTLRLTVGQSVSMSWCQAQIWDIWPEIFFFKVTLLFFWCALSDERSGLSCVSLCHWILP